GFVIAGVAAYYTLKNENIHFAQSSFKIIFPLLTLVMCLQITIGDWVGLNVIRYQPIKTAAIEAVWETLRGAPFILYAIPHQKLQKNFLEIKIPKLASFLNTHVF